MTHATADTEPISCAEDAEAYVAMVCFKHGPPERIGVELEWTVHHRDDQDRPLDPRLLAEALGSHAPPTVAPQSTHQPLPHGSLVTVVESDIAALDALLEAAGLRRGDSGIDPHRPPTRLLDLPRYAAMQDFFDGRGPWGSSMMCSTASMQVCHAGHTSDAPGGPRTGSARRSARARRSPTRSSTTATRPPPGSSG